MAVCEAFDPDCYGCQQRAKGFSLSRAATPNRPQHHVHRPCKEPSWEKGLAGEHRPDGSFMPYLSPGTMNPMGVHEYASSRRKVDEQVRRLKSPSKE